MNIVTRQLGVRTRVAESADGAIDQARVLLFEIVIPQTHLGQSPDPEVFDQHIAFFGEALCDCDALLVLQVQRKAALVPVCAEIVGRLAVHERGAPGPCLVAHARTFDFDHVGTKVAQHHRASRTGELPGHVEHSESF